jgi:hypothetical protein
MAINLVESLTLPGLYAETQWHTNPQLGWWDMTPCICFDCRTVFNSPAAQVGQINVRGEFRCYSCNWEKYTDKIRWVKFWRGQKSIPKQLLPLIERMENGTTTIQE